MLQKIKIPKIPHVMTIEDLYKWSVKNNCEGFRLSIYDGRSRFTLTEEHLYIDYKDKAVKI